MSTRDLRTMADVSDGETLEEDGDWVLVTYRDGRRAMILKVLLEDRWLRSVRAAAPR
jgi:uncharacterized protein YgiM (DUF1202 family)